ncbi:MAG: type IV pilus modification PilV family protein [Mycobacteriales bacterium]
MRHRSRRRLNDRGFTMAETLVSIIVFGLVAVAVTEASISGLNHQRSLQNREDALAQARTALQRVDRDIRSADYPVWSVSATSLVLAEKQPTVTRRMTYSVVGADLTVDERDYWTSGSVTNAPTRTLLKNLVNTGTSPVFSFAPYTGYGAPSGIYVNTATCAMTGGTIDTGCVGTITVALSVRPEYLHEPVSVTDNGTELRNAP